MAQVLSEGSRAQPVPRPQTAFFRDALARIVPALIPTQSAEGATASSSSLALRVGIGCTQFPGACNPDRPSEWQGASYIVVRAQSRNSTCRGARLDRSCRAIRLWRAHPYEAVRIATTAIPRPAVDTATIHETCWSSAFQAARRLRAPPKSRDARPP